MLSPCNGTITELCFSNGDTITPNQVIFKVEEGGRFPRSCDSCPCLVICKLVMNNVHLSEPSAAPAKKAEAPKPAAKTEEAPKAEKKEEAPKKAAPAAPATSKPAEQGSIPKSPPPVPPKPSQAAEVRSVSASDATPPGRTEARVKMTRMRQTIARRLKEAQNNCAMLTTFNEIDMR